MHHVGPGIMITVEMRMRNKEFCLRGLFLEFIQVNGHSMCAQHQVGSIFCRAEQPRTAFCASTFNSMSIPFWSKHGTLRHHSYVPFYPARACTARGKVISRGVQVVVSINLHFFWNQSFLSKYSLSEVYLNTDRLLNGLSYTLAA